MGSRFSVLRIEELEPRLALSLPSAAPFLGPPPAAGPGVAWVNTVAGLQKAVSDLQSGETIVIQKGTYNLAQTLYIGNHRQLTGVTLRGATDNYKDVVLLGKGMETASY